MRDKGKAFLAWVYEWITVITAVVVGALPAVVSQLDMISGIDLGPLLPSDLSVKIITGVAIAKWLCVTVLWITGRSEDE